MQSHLHGIVFNPQQLRHLNHPAILQIMQHDHFPIPRRQFPNRLAHLPKRVIFHRALPTPPAIPQITHPDPSPTPRPHFPNRRAHPPSRVLFPRPPPPRRSQFQRPPRRPPQRPPPREQSAPMRAAFVERNHRQPR